VCGFSLELAETMKLNIAHYAALRRGLNMRQIADALGIEHQTVMYWNQGRAHPRLPMVLRLLYELRCTFEELVGA
jgi:transcriptional regulator with XRE-family HTH domain